MRDRRGAVASTVCPRTRNACDRRRAATSLSRHHSSGHRRRLSPNADHCPVRASLVPLPLPLRYRQRPSRAAVCHQTTVLLVLPPQLPSPRSPMHACRVSSLPLVAADARRSSTRGGLCGLAEAAGTASTGVRRRAERSNLAVPLDTSRDLKP